MSEFTGERLVPGKVEDRLWQEHVSRYVFAAQLCAGRRHVVDAGCGMGYGTRILAEQAQKVSGIDISLEAVAYARSTYSLSNMQFVAGNCESLPLVAGYANAVVAFEVIEHLARWRNFLIEVRHALAPEGLFIVSTPNAAYYTTSRGFAGANPFHVHEFELEEFRMELTSEFAYVKIFEQNHAEVLAFTEVGHHKKMTGAFGNAADNATEANFFVAVCSGYPVADIPSFVYLPRSGNILLERERHIQLLEDELRDKAAELSALHAEHASLVLKFRAQTQELESSNGWAAQVGIVSDERAQRVLDLQNEVKEKIEGYEGALRNEEAMRAAEVGHAVEALRAAESMVDERTRWALGLQSHIDELTARLQRLESTRWVRVGRKVGAVKP